ncbi:hypothetical protein Dimus_024552, partial [Dionaea muscipula]
RFQFISCSFCWGFLLLPLLMPRRRRRRSTIAVNNLRLVVGLIPSNCDSSTCDSDAMNSLDPIDKEPHSASDKDDFSLSVASRSPLVLSMDVEEPCQEIQQELHNLIAFPQVNNKLGHDEPNCRVVEASISLEDEGDPNRIVDSTSIRVSPPPDLGKAPIPDVPSSSDPCKPEIPTRPSSGSSKGQWNQLFANNRKPLDDFKLKKVDFQSSEGCIDLSDSSLADEFLFEAPHCLIGYFYDPSLATDLTGLPDIVDQPSHHPQSSTEHHPLVQATSVVTIPATAEGMSSTSDQSSLHESESSHQAHSTQDKSDLQSDGFHQ